MKFIHYLESIAGIAIFPMISLFIFFMFFTVLIIYAIRADRQHISELENLPLEQDDNQQSNSNQS